VKTAPVYFNERQIRHAFNVAQRNWSNWSCVFGHKGSLRTNPILTDSTLFSKFCNEYSVGRTIRKSNRDCLRLELLTSQEFAKAIGDDTGERLAAYEKRLRKRFASGKHHSSLVSAISKVAAFLRPQRFVAWDRFARKGVNLTVGNTASSPFENYSEYLEAVDRTWREENGKRIRDAASEMAKNKFPLRNELRFQRRVLDVCLMNVGGRKI
jgi:hypothetical protein